MAYGVSEFLFSLLSDEICCLKLNCSVTTLQRVEQGQNLCQVLIAVSVPHQGDFVSFPILEAEQQVRGNSTFISRQMNKCPQQLISILLPFWGQLLDSPSLPVIVVIISRQKLGVNVYFIYFFCAPDNVTCYYCHMCLC